MRLKDKYPDTKTFHWYNANPHNRVTGDCVFRAIATALDADYNETLMEMAVLQCKTGFALNDTKGIEKYMLSKGWIKCAQPRKSDNTKFTGDEWCRWLNKNDNRNKSIVCNIGGHHTVCIKKIDGLFKVFDIWNSTDGCIGNYYIKNE